MGSIGRTAPIFRRTRNYLTSKAPCEVYMEVRKLVSPAAPPSSGKLTNSKEFSRGLCSFNKVSGRGSLVASLYDRQEAGMLGRSVLHDLRNLHQGSKKASGNREAIGKTKETSR